MKNRKSYYSLLLALVLCLCLTACGGSDDTIDDGGEDYSGNEVNTPDSFEPCTGAPGSTRTTTAS